MSRRLRALLALARAAGGRRTTGVVVLSVAVACCSTFIGLLFKVLADGVVAGDRTPVLVAAVLLAVAQTFQNAGGRYVLLLVADIHDRATLSMNRDLMRLAGRTPGLEHHERPDYLDRMALLREDTRVLADALRQAIVAVVLVVRVVTTALLLASVHPALLVLPIFSFPSLWTGARSRRIVQRARESSAAQGRLLDHLLGLSAGVTGSAEARIFGLGPEIGRRARDLWDERAEVIARAQLRASLLQAGGWATFAVGYAAAIVWVVLRALDGDATAGDVLLVVVLAAQVNGQVGQSVALLGTSLDAAKAVDRRLWLQDYAAGAAQPTGADPPRPLRRGISLRGVTFRYPGTDTDVLHDVDLDLPAGASVAIVGENGAGKTTLVKLLCRFYAPTSGTITVDGVDLQSLDVEAWRAQLAGGFQDFARLELKLRESVGVGDLPRIDDAPAVAAALARTEGGDVAAGLAEGLEAQLGRQFDGAELSTGQWQKVAVARAVLRETPTLLLLDEPSSGLDARAEHVLLERYTEAAREVAATTGAATVLVSHRFSTVRSADLIVVLENGRVVERGTHAELMAAGGAYADLYIIQARAYC
ncbi:MAG: ABC transporter ATP-binding protein/permease [Actinomycetota bacterium]|nr:ABC transporter ATP-binding protein/permease [Actinomycetota bacterium]